VMAVVASRNSRLRRYAGRRMRCTVASGVTSKVAAWRNRSLRRTGLDPTSAGCDPSADPSVHCELRHDCAHFSSVVVGAPHWRVLTSELL
jgi:hypothetical protein